MVYGMGAGDSYDVTLSQISDQVLWRILYRGYMGSSYTDWSLECDDDLYYATKTAVHSMAEGVSPKDKYEIATRVGKFDQGLSLEEVQRRSRKVLDVAQQLYDYGYNGSENYMKATLTINEQGDLVEQTINGSEYVVQNYSVTSNKELSSYKVSISGFPEGTKIFNNSNNETQQITSSNFKIAILKSNIQNDIDGYINITEAQVKTYPVFYADSLNEHTQNYVTFADPSESSSASKKANISTDKSSLRIIKKDRENNRPIGGVTFEIKYSDGTDIGEYTTDDLGIIQIDNLRIGDITIQEISAPEFYIVDSTIINETLEFNSTTTVNLTNVHKKGNLRVEKITKDDKTIQLGNVEFELYLVGGGEIKLYIGTYYTDVNGEIYIPNLNTGNYMLKETKTNRWYYLKDDTKIEVKWSKQYGDTIARIENEKKKGIIKIIKTDKDFKEHPLQSIEFKVYDEDNNYIETIATNVKGIAESSRLRIDKKYYVKETKTLENYILNDNIYIIDFIKGLTKDEINNIQKDTIYEVSVTNEHKKGNLKVHKIDADTNKSLEGIKFELYAKNVDAPYKKDELIGTYVTDSDGKIEIDNLWTGEYYLKEIETDIYHKLNTKEVAVKIKHDETTEITVKNELKKGQVKVVKIDKDNNEVKLEGVTFEILNKDMKVVDEIVTDENGEAISKKLPCVNEEYFVREKETKESYVLSNEIKRIVLEEDKIRNLTFKNEKIKGYIKIIKTSLDDNPITGDTAGTPIPNITFNVYDLEGNIVDVLTTDSKGIATSDLLVYGQYIVKEESEGKYWQLNTNEYIVDIKENLETVEVNIKNESDKPDVDIEKTGIIQTTENQEIRYDFHIKNTGNTNLDNFTWFDCLPADYVKMSKLITGTYNQDLTYSIYYKTNLNDYKVLVENLSTQNNNYIDFSKIQLEEGEVITEFRADFGTVDVGFESVIDPYIFVITNDALEDDATFTNRTRIEGSHEGYLVWDEDDHTTKVYKKEIEVKKLPRTGF